MWNVFKLIQNWAFLYIFLPPSLKVENMHFLQHPHGLQILHHGSSIGNIFLISPYYFILIHYNKLADTKVKIVPKFISIFMCMHIYLLMRKSHKAAFTGQPK